MTTPMESLPHKVVRCTRDLKSFLPLFVPDEDVKEIIRYALGLCCTEFRGQVWLLGGIYDLTRERLVLYDLKGCLSDFFERLHQVLAKALIKKYGIGEAAWRPNQQFRRQYLETDADVLDALAEVRAMPVKLGRVKYASRYPGVVLDEDYHDPITIERPNQFFGPGYPDSVTLEMHRPPCFEHLTQSQWETMLRKRAQEVERAYRNARRRSGEGFLGEHALCQLDPLMPLPPHHRPEELPRESVRAFHDPERGVQVERRLRAFKPRYRKPWKKFARGDHSVVFPAGTFQVARYAGATTDDAREAARRHGYPVRGAPEHRAWP